MIRRLCMVPHLTGTGGMVSFQGKLAAGLAARGIQFTYDLDDAPYDAVLVIAGTRQLGKLLRARRQGVPIIQRLDGINWLHRVRKASLRYRLRAETGNLLLALIRSRFADRVVYQSEFVRGWWEDWYGRTRVPYFIVHNGVDLNIYSPHGPGERPSDRYRIMLVEGSLSEAMSIGLDWAVKLAEHLAGDLRLPVELSVAAKVTPAGSEAWSKRSRVPVTFLGVVPRERIPELDRSAHFYFSAEVNPPCPNAVIEALACGLPVAAFSSGSIPELVTPDAGAVVPYGGDPWKVEPPDIPALAAAAVSLLEDQPRFRAGARERAELAFGLDSMVDKYLQAIQG